MQWKPGNNVGIGNDFTLYALIDGHGTFEKPLPGRRQRVSVYPAVAEAANVS